MMTAANPALFKAKGLDEPTEFGKADVPEFPGREPVP